MRCRAYLHEWLVLGKQDLSCLYRFDILLQGALVSQMKMQNIRPEIWVLQHTWSKWKRCCICVYVFEGRRAATFCSLHVIMPVSLHMGMHSGKRRWQWWAYLSASSQHSAMMSSISLSSSYLRYTSSVN